MLPVSLWLRQSDGHETDCTEGHETERDPVHNPAGPGSMRDTFKMTPHKIKQDDYAEESGRLHII